MLLRCLLAHGETIQYLLVRTFKDLIMWPKPQIYNQITKQQSLRTRRMLLVLVLLLSCTLFPTTLDCILDNKCFNKYHNMHQQSIFHVQIEFEQTRTKRQKHRVESFLFSSSVIDVLHLNQVIGIFVMVTTTIPTKFMIN